MTIDWNGGYKSVKMPSFRKTVRDRKSQPEFQPLNTSLHTRREWLLVWLAAWLTEGLADWLAGWLGDCCCCYTCRGVVEEVQSRREGEMLMGCSSVGGYWWVLQMGVVGTQDGLPQPSLPYLRTSRRCSARRPSMTGLCLQWELPAPRSSCIGKQKAANLHSCNE